MAEMKITIYTIPKCPYCLRAKEWLDQNHLRYEEIVVPNSKSDRTVLDQFEDYLPGDWRGVPVIVVEKSGEKIYSNDETDPTFQKMVLAISESSDH